MWGQSTSWRKLELAERRYITIVDDTSVPVAINSSAESDLGTNGKSGGGWSWPITAIGSWFESKADESGEVALPILRVRRKTVAGIDFGPHGWSTGIVYAAHPKVSGVYRPLASFYEDLLLQKITELERLINALGAKEYRISHVKKSDRSSASRLDFLNFLGGGATSRRTDLVERIWSGTSEGHRPWVPADLVWLDSEPAWRNLIESRLNGTRKKFEFTVRQDEDCGFDLKLATSIKALKLDIGGEYKTTQHVEFSVSGSF